MYVYCIYSLWFDSTGARTYDLPHSSFFLLFVLFCFLFCCFVLFILLDEYLQIGMCFHMDPIAYSMIVDFNRVYCFSCTSWLGFIVVLRNLTIWRMTCGFEVWIALLHDSCMIVLSINVLFLVMYEKQKEKKKKKEKKPHISNWKHITSVRNNLPQVCSYKEYQKRYWEKSR
jgi:hypothetical protein